MEQNLYMMKSDIKTKRRRVRPLQLLYRLFVYVILRILDGRTNFYMRLKIFYLKTLGVKIVCEPLYICADIHLDSSDFSLITIGNNTVISSEVRILNHDYSITKALIYSHNHIDFEVRKLAPVTLEESCFIGMRTLILPGVTVGKNSIIGAGSVVTHDIPADVVAAGNPAKVICSLDDYSKKVEQQVKQNSGQYYKS